MTGENPITTFFNALFTGNFLDFITDKSLDSTTDDQLEIERYQLEVQRFNTIKQHHREIQDRQDKIMSDYNYDE